MSDSRYDSSDTKSSGLGLTRPSILGSGADLNKPGSRRGIQGISLTPARSIAPARVSLSSGRPQREQYQSVYSNRLGGSLTNSAPNISNLSVPSDRQSKDNLGEPLTPRRANISSLRLSPRRGSPDPRLTKLEQINDDNPEVNNSETPRRGSDVVRSSLQRQLILGEGGYIRNPAVNLSRTHSDIEYSQRLRRASRNSATYSPKSPEDDAKGNGDHDKLDSGYNSPKFSKFTYDDTAKSIAKTNDTGLAIRNEIAVGNSGNLTNKLAGTSDKINVKGFDSVDGETDTVNRIEKVRYDSGYHSPRYERVTAVTDNQNQLDKGVADLQGEKQGPGRQKPALIVNLSKNLPDAKGNRQYSYGTCGASSEISDKVEARGTVNSAAVGYNKDFTEIQTTKQKPVSRVSNLASTPENSILKTSLNNNSVQLKQSSGPADMSASKGNYKPVDVSPAGLSQNAVAEECPKPQPRTRRRLTKRISFKKVEDDEYIGFASLPEQVHRKAVRRGFEFTLMVVGETGLGKSTLINSLFLTDLYKDRKITNIEERVQKTVDLEKKELEIEERGVKLKLTIVDTPGFNDAVNAEESWKPIVNYVDSQFDAYFQAESGLNRKNIKDTRVHCCLYFISPYGHGLRPVDVSVMKKLHNKVNIVPLIAKSDMLTKPECKRLKQKIIDEIEKHRIHIYQFPDCDSDEDDEFKQQDKELKASIPFAVVGSNTVVEAPGGKKIRGRMYPWGIVEVENPSHCDFIRLRQMLIGTHMQDLKDVTCDSHYENYRAEHISEQMGTQRRDRNKLKRDSAANMEAVLETDLLLQQKEAEIQRMREMMRQMEAKIRNQNGPQTNGRVGHV